MRASSETLRNFEWDRILEQLTALGTCPATRDQILKLKPLPDSEAIKEALEETGECLDMIRFDGTIDFRPFPDLRDALARASIAGSVLPLPELIQIGQFLHLERRVKRYFRENRIFEKYPHLKKGFEATVDFTSLRELFTRSISEEGRVLDSASSGVAQARRTIRRIEESLKDTLDSFLRQPSHARHLQELHYTIRRGRYVVPVKSQSRNLVEGLIIDSSSTGSTVFIEPRAVLFLNNELEVALFREKEEIERVYRTLTDAVRVQSDFLNKCFLKLVHLEFLQAKARLARDWDASHPKVDTLNLSLIQARHPLLGKRAIPFDLTIIPDRNVLVVSGPNAGGKTVLLKTIALSIYLTHCGLFPPLSAGSEIPLYKSLHVDIGDHQDLENDLSTFTSRISRLRTMLNETGRNTVMLFDELGSGTDPEEGSALARAILEHLRKAGATCVVTTHFPDVKYYASETPGMETASMEFDPVRLAPTFRLSVGETGGSYGLEIAARVGLPKELIDRSMAFMNQERVNLDRLILDQHHTKSSLQQKENELTELIRITSKEKKQIELTQQELAENRRQFTREYRDQLAAFLKKTREEVAQLVGALRRESLLDESAYQVLKNRLKKENEQLMRIDQTETQPPDKEPVPPQPGDLVYVSELKKRGTVLFFEEKKERALVEVDGLKIEVALDKIRREDRPEKSHATTIQYSLLSEERIAPEIEIRKMRVEEALQKLDKYFDRVVLAGYTSVSVIHGRGEGVLRQVTQDFLRGHPHVSCFRDGTPGEGGIGVTVVDLIE